VNEMEDEGKGGGSRDERREREGCRKREEERGEREWREERNREGKREGKGETRHTNPNFLPAPLMSIVTRCSAIAERPRCRVRYSFRQK